MAKSSATAYVQIYRKIMGRNYWGMKKHGKRFTQLDRKLKTLGIDPGEYVCVSVQIWQEFVEEKGMKFLPLNILTSPKAIERYIELDPVTDSDLALGLLTHYEQGAAVIKIQALLGERDDLDTDLQDFLPDDYDDLVTRHSGKWSEISQAALKSAAKRYHVVPEFMDVDSIAQAIIQKGKKS